MTVASPSGERNLDIVNEMPISEATGHLDEVAAESAATGEIIYLTRDGQRLAAIVPAAVTAELDGHHSDLNRPLEG